MQRSNIEALDLWDYVIDMLWLALGLLALGVGITLGPNGWWLSLPGLVVVWWFTEPCLVLVYLYMISVQNNMTVGEVADLVSVIRRVR